jgi:hypothetical protein
MHIYRRVRFSAAVMGGLLGLMLLAVPKTVQAAKFFVDGTELAVKPEEKVAPTEPKPVQLLFEFQRDGGLNPQATKYVKPFIVEDLTASGFFSQVSETPAAEGAVLSIKFNNIINPEELAKAKKDGFRTGLTFGLFASTVVTDYYQVTFDYIAHPGATPVTTVVYHRLVTTMGKIKEPVSGVEFKKVDIAVRELVRQVMGRGINNVFTPPSVTS